MGRKTLCLLTAFVITVGFFSPIEPLAAPYYEGKRIKIVDGVSGGYAAIARILAKYLPEYIPGKPTFYLEDMQGADSIIAANYVYNVAKPDGLTLGIVNRGLPFAALLKAEGVKFDIRKFSWIGSPTVESNVITIRSDLPYKTVKDLQEAKTPIKLGASGPNSSSTHFPLLLNEFAGTKFKMVFYLSSPEIALAIARKEIDGKATSYGSFRKEIETGVYRSFIRSRISEPEIENLPVDEDLTTSPLGKKLMAMRTGPDWIGRPYVAPPNTPPEIMNILLEAFGKACQNPEVKAMLVKIGMRPQWVPADQCRKILDDLFNQPPDVVKEFSRYVKF